MEKKSYEAIRNIRTRCATGTATFAERNILKIMERRATKGQAIHAPRPGHVFTQAIRNKDMRLQ